MWPSSLLTSVQPKGAEHNRVPDVCTTQSDQICQVELIWPVPIWSQTNCCWWKYCSLSTKTLCCSRGKLWPPLPVLVKLFLGKLVQHPMAPHEWERRKHCTALSDTHTLMALSIGVCVCVHTKTRHMETAQSSSESDQSDQKAISCKIRRAALSPLLHYFFILRSASMALRRPLVPPSCSRDTKKRGERERARLT